MYDLTVVGGSAIGLYLATKFRKKGWSVLVLEKKKEIGGKVCSGLVSKHLFEALGMEKKEIEKQNFFEKRFSGARIWIENTPFDFSGLAYLINRRLFEEYLFKKAKESEVEIKLGEEAEKVLEREGFVEVSTKSKKTFQGRILAGCDGLNSVVTKEAGLSTHKKMLLGVIANINQKAADEKKRADYPELFFLKEFPGFFGWRIPRKSEVEWGLALEPKYEPKKRLEKFLLSNIQYPISNIQFKYAPIPLFPLNKTSTKRIFLCGDAAGQIKPFSGGGLTEGFTCAKIASQLINPKEPNLNLYEDGWRREITKEIVIGKLILKCYRLPSFVKKIALSFLQNKKNLDQDKPSNLF